MVSSLNIPMCSRAIMLCTLQHRGCYYGEVLTEFQPYEYKRWKLMNMSVRRIVAKQYILNTLRNNSKKIKRNSNSV